MTSHVPVFLSTFFLLVPWLCRGLRNVVLVLPCSTETQNCNKQIDMQFFSQSYGKMASFSSKQEIKDMTFYNLVDHEV